MQNFSVIYTTDEAVNKYHLLLIGFYNTHPYKHLKNVLGIYAVTAEKDIHYVEIC